MRPLFPVIIAAAVVWGCAAAPSISPSASSATDSPVASASPAASEVAIPPSAPPDEMGEPLVEPAPSFSPTELELFRGLREDVQTNCVPSREGLPTGAIAGIECDLNSGIVARVGAYRFERQDLAFLAYAERMSSYGVALRSGDCYAGSPGDSAWMPGDDPDENGDSVFRSGCFLNENGVANVRLTCQMPSMIGSGNYVGVLGTNADLAALFEWAWRYPEGAEMDVPTPPGICFNDSLQAPDL